MTTPSKFAIKIRRQHQPLTFEVKKAPFYVTVGETIVVETTRGEEAGIVVKLPLACNKHGLHENIIVRQIIRIATTEDKKRLLELPKLEQEFLQKANALFEEKADGVKIISCELLFSRKKLIFYYRGLETEQAAKDKSNKHKPALKPDHKPVPRFNSREMNKELFHLLNIPIEIKEMGNRASAYVIGGIGHCGCGLCCTTWLSKPRQVSVKMAKEQSLAINIPKLSGVCGKLLCCLSYEHTQYENGMMHDVHKKQKADTEYLGMFEKNSVIKN
jgi:cell fate regulator YaaT (PSP1 superfamily)